MIRLISWNMKHLPSWDELAKSGVDVALLQEVPTPTASSVGLEPDPRILEVLPGGDNAWRTAGWERRDWRTAVARLSASVQLDPIATADVATCDWETLMVSRTGTLTAADVVVDDRVVFTAVSVYAPWERPLGRNKPMWADASAHRLLSDLTPLLWDQRRRPVLVAGDWNILYRYGEYDDPEFRDRYATVFDRADALGLRFVGPQHPDGRQADPWPDELPRESKCVPTYYHSRQTAATATRQLDFVFASASLADRVHTEARNEPAEWGSSDHCRISIEVDA